MSAREGGCHCGAVRFRIEIADEDRDVLDCNCSVCTKKGFLHLVVPEGKFEITRGAEQLASYTFGTHVAQHQFCRTCGIHAFYRPRSQPDHWDVNVRCLDDVPLSHWRISAFDGRNWESAVLTLRGGA